MKVKRELLLASNIRDNRKKVISVLWKGGKSRDYLIGKEGKSELTGRRLQGIHRLSLPPEPRRFVCSVAQGGCADHKEQRARPRAPGARGVRPGVAKGQQQGQRWSAREANQIATGWWNIQNLRWQHGSPVKRYAFHRVWSWRAIFDV